MAKVTFLDTAGRSAYCAGRLRAGRFTQMPPWRGKFLGIET
ncbi:hypothetical protein [Paracoccus aminovorans]|nr:hypothetical protein [Paracoccus aminovorans]